MSAAKVPVPDDARPTPARRLEDGQNYKPTNNWVLFGRHFAAITASLLMAILGSTLVILGAAAKRVVLEPRRKRGVSAETASAAG